MGPGLPSTMKARATGFISTDSRSASRPITNGEFLAFMEDGGYSRPELWLSDGWNHAASHHWEAPLYWERVDGSWWTMTLGGFRPVRGCEPVCHVSYYEADAYARWAGFRLPTEARVGDRGSTRSAEGDLPRD